MKSLGKGSDALSIIVSQYCANPENKLATDHKIQDLANSLVILAQDLQSTLNTGDQPHRDYRSSQNADQPPPLPNYAEIAERTYRNRRRRAEIFADDTLFGEPAWDILLDLFVAAEKGKRVAVSSACIGAGVPNTTALRWLNVLETRGLVEREDDNRDARRSFVRLTTRGHTLMREYFSS